MTRERPGRSANGQTARSFDPISGWQAIVSRWSEASPCQPGSPGQGPRIYLFFPFFRRRNPRSSLIPPIVTCVYHVTDGYSRKCKNLSLSTQMRVMISLSSGGASRGGSQSGLLHTIPLSTKKAAGDENNVD